MAVYYGVTWSKWQPTSGRRAAMRKRLQGTLEAIAQRAADARSMSHRYVVELMAEFKSEAESRRKPAEAAWILPTHANHGALEQGRAESSSSFGGEAVQVAVPTLVLDTLSDVAALLTFGGIGARVVGNRLRLDDEDIKPPRPAQIAVTA